MHLTGGNPGQDRSSRAWHMLGLVLVACCLGAGSASAEYSFRSGVEVLGYDDASHRIYYLVVYPINPGAHQDSIRAIEYFALDSLTAQPALVMEYPTATTTREKLAGELKQLRARLSPLRAVTALDSVTVSRTSYRSELHEDYIQSVGVYEARYAGMRGAYSTYDVCNEPVELTARSVYRVPGQNEGVAVFDKLRSRLPTCQFTLVLLLSSRPLEPLRREWDQVP